MPRRCRLTARAQIDGAIREPGYVFMLADDERGPHRAIRPVHPSIHASHIAGHDYPGTDGADEPLFVVLPEEKPVLAEPVPVPPPEPVPQVPEVQGPQVPVETPAERAAHIARLEAELAAELAARPT